MAIGVDGKEHALPFCAYDPAWTALPIALDGSINETYGGISLAGPCPRCRHAGAITLFVPTTWVRLGAGGPQVAALAAADALRITATLEAAQASGSTVDFDGQQLVIPERKDASAEFLVEVAVCHCQAEHEHQTPAGRSGCGFWGYVHLRRD